MKINKEELRTKLDLMKPSIDRKAMTIEQMGHFVFTGSNIYIINNSVYMSMPMETDFKASVPAEEFHNIVKKAIPDDEGNIEIVIDNNNIRIIGENLKAGMALYAEDEITEYYDGIVKDSKAGFRPLPEGLLEAVGHCLFSASNNPAMATLTCVNCEEQYVVCGDNYRISRYKHSGEVDQFLAQASAVHTLMNMPSVTEYLVGSSWVHFKNDAGVLFSIRRVIGDYPDFSSVFDLPYPNKVIIKDSKKLIEALDAACVFSDVSNQLDLAVKVDVGENQIVCSSTNEQGWADAFAEAEHSGEPIVFHINPVFFSQVLKNINEFYVGDGKIHIIEGNFEHIIVTYAKE